MNDADIDLINKTFYPGWLMVSQLRSGQEVKDGEALYRRACRWVNAARESLNKAGFSTTSCEHMLYAYCALMDESVLNPAFLRAVDTLSHISDVVFTRGEAGLSFELRPGTADGIMETRLVIDSQKLTYMNQMPAWKRFIWPADTEAPGAALSWISTQAGTRQYADIRLRPGESVTLDMPMEESAQVVAVAGMFMAPDQVNDTWRITLTRDDLDPDKARVIEVSNNRLTLKPLEGE